MSKNEKSVGEAGRKHVEANETEQRPSPGIQPKGPAPDIETKKGLPTKERALEQALEESMDASDPPAITQPGKNFVGPKD